MKALDTNVLLRIVDRTDARQAAQVERLIRQPGQGPFFLSTFVILEFGWTLARRYRTPRSEIVTWLRFILEAPEFIVEQATLVSEAVSVFATSKADFGDCMVGVSNLASGCTTTITFDGEAAAMTTLFSPIPN